MGAAPTVWSFKPKEAYYHESFTVTINGQNYVTDTSLNPIYLTNGNNNGLITNDNLYGYNTLGFSVDGWDSSDQSKKEIHLKFHADKFTTLLQPWQDLHIWIYGTGGRSEVVTIPIIGHVAELSLKPEKESIPAGKKMKVQVSALDVDKKNVDARVSLKIDSPSGKGQLFETEVSTSDQGYMVTVTDPVQESVTLSANYISSPLKNGYTRTAESTFRFDKPLIQLSDENIDTSSFSDISSDFWAIKSITSLHEKNNINGFPDGSFRPDEFVTRGQWAALLNNSFNLPDKTSGSYTDVTKDRWDYPFIQKAGELIPSLNGKFKPDDPITREDTITSLIMAMGSDQDSVDATVLGKFSDQDKLSNDAKKYIGVAVSKGIIGGLPDGTFQPQGSLTRAQSAAILYNAIRSLSVVKVNHPVLQVRSSGEDVKVLQQMLTDLHYDVGG
jgi:hypothetical protein